jgi:predicted transcriptional regulator
MIPELVKKKKEEHEIKIISTKKKSQESLILDEILNDPDSILYFSSVVKLTKMLKSLSKNKLRIVIQFKQEPIKNKKILRGLIKENFKVGESTISHYLSRFLKSGLFKEEENNQISFTKLGKILVEELDFLLNTLAENDKIPNEYTFVDDNIIIPLSKKFNIYIVKSLSYNSVNFSDLLDRVNIMLKISEGTKNIIFSSDFSYYLTELKELNIIDKRENKYVLLELGELLVEFINAVLLKILDYKLRKSYLDKTVKDFMLVSSKLQKLRWIYKKDLKKDHILEICNLNPIVLSKDDNYLGILSPLYPQLITSYWMRDDWEERDFKTEMVLEIPPINMEDSLLKALFIMRENNLRSIPVAEGDKIVATFDLQNFSKTSKL